MREIWTDRAGLGLSLSGPASTPLASSKENVTCFAGILHGYYWVASWDEESQFALLPASGGREPSLMIAEGLVETTRMSWIEDVRP